MTKLLNAPTADTGRIAFGATFKNHRSKSHAATTDAGRVRVGATFKQVRAR